MGGRSWINSEYIRGRFVWNRCRLVVSAKNRAGKPAATHLAGSVTPPAAIAAVPRRPDSIKASNVKVEAGAGGYSTVSFDLAWANSWRAKWKEPAEKNVTGKPLDVENWDAAWVFLKFREPGSNAFLHTTLSSEVGDHRVPAGVALDVGLSNDGRHGVGVFVYRNAIGSGANDFKNIKLRWLHTADKADPSKAVMSAHVIGMVYVPGGPFQSKVPWQTSLTTIRIADATKEGGCRVATNTAVNAAWPNGYNAFYSTKYAISQGQYAEFLNSQGPAEGDPGRYGLSRFMIRCDTNAAVYVAEVPDRGCNFLNWKQILSYEAWAGLRPPTDLEYEKACRGPRAVARGEEAWSAGICAPSPGIGKGLVPDLPDNDAGASYWGIRGLSLSGCVQEWPGIIFDNDEYGSGYKGMHGEGRTAPPEDWPTACSIGAIYGVRNCGDVATWLVPADLDRAVILGEGLIFDRTGRYGARAVRTAP